MTQGQYNYEIYLLLTHGRRYHEKLQPCDRCGSFNHATARHTPTAAYAEFRNTIKIKQGVTFFRWEDQRAAVP